MATKPKKTARYDLNVRELQGDLPLVPRPYAAVARKLNIDEDLLLEKIRWMKEQG